MSKRQISERTEDRTRAKQHETVVHEVVCAREQSQRQLLYEMASKTAAANFLQFLTGDHLRFLLAPLLSHHPPIGTLFTLQSGCKIRPHIQWRLKKDADNYFQSDNGTYYVRCRNKIHLFGDKKLGSFKIDRTPPDGFPVDGLVLDADSIWRVDTDYTTKITRVISDRLVEFVRLKTKLVRGEMPVAYVDWHEVATGRLVSIRRHVEPFRPCCEPDKRVLTSITTLSCGTPAILSYISLLPRPTGWASAVHLSNFFIPISLTTLNSDGSNTQLHFVRPLPRDDHRTPNSGSLVFRLLRRKFYILGDVLYALVTLHCRAPWHRVEMPKNQAVITVHKWSLTTGTVVDQFVLRDRDETMFAHWKDYEVHVCADEIGQFVVTDHTNHAHAYDVNGEMYATWKLEHARLILHCNINKDGRLACASTRSYGSRTGDESRLDIY